MDEPRILLADDHPLVRMGIRRALEDDGLSVIAETADGPSAVAAALELLPDLCLLDVHMPGGGIAAAAEIVQALPDTVVVMLSVSAADTDLFEALRVGAAGYLLKDTDPARLPQAVRAVLTGEAPLPRVLTARLIKEYQRRGTVRNVRGADGALVTLSERALEVLELRRENLTTRQVGERLGISPVTVRRHMSDVAKKLGHKHEAVLK
jgi:DNA-binding NarL/FixJ family response regulator